MLKWCAYCQTFNGESEPYNDFSVSHGICQRCLPSHKSLPNTIPKHIKNISSFFRANWEAAQQGSPKPPEDIIFEGRKLGISNKDLLMGILQPLLYLVGQEFEEGNISVATEQKFTKVTNKILSLIQHEKEDRSKFHTTDVLFIQAKGNGHSIGLYFLKEFLEEEGIHVHLVTPGVELEEAKKIIGEEDPFIVGLSLSLPWQIDYANDLVQSQAIDGPLYVGGSLFKTFQGSPGLEKLDPSTKRIETHELIATVKDWKEKFAA